jgi:hypothetical protein
MEQGQPITQLDKYVLWHQKDDMIIHAVYGMDIKPFLFSTEAEATLYINGGQSIVIHFSKLPEHLQKLVLNRM